MKNLRKIDVFGAGPLDPKGPARAWPPILNYREKSGRRTFWVKNRQNTHTIHSKSACPACPFFRVRNSVKIKQKTPNQPPWVCWTKTAGGSLGCRQDICCVCREDICCIKSQDICCSSRKDTRHLNEIDDTTGAPLAPPWRAPSAPLCRLAGGDWLHSLRLRVSHIGPQRGPGDFRAK